MRISNKKQAYSLAEIMTVMLVLTVIFAAFAPFMTKRWVATRNVDTPWVLTDQQSYDAQTDPGNNTNRNQMFFGITPKSGDEVESQYQPFAKLVIRSGEVTGGLVQRQLQFRYGLNNSSSKYTDKGKYAGTWLMDGKNVLMGGGYRNIVTKNSGSTQASKNNTAIGYNALNKITYGVWFKIGNHSSWLITLVIGIMLIIFGILVLANPFASLTITKLVGSFLILASILDITDLILLKNKSDEITKIFW